MAVSEAAAATHYVSVISANPTSPYTNWATAATNIQQAVNASAAGDLILVTNGVYAESVVITNALALMSMSGPEDTRIDLYTLVNAGYSGGCVRLTDGASLSGFTLANGWGGPEGVGVWCPSTNAFLTNCVIAGNRAFQGSGGGAHGGTLYKCTLTANLATNNSGGAYGSTLINCVVSNNIAGGVNFCTLFNTLVISNRYEPGPESDGGAANSTLYNCTVVGNGYGVSSCALYNSISYYNSSSIGGNYDPFAPFDLSTFHYCCTTPMPTNGVGNITNAPLFVDLANGNLRLQSNSPCINAGNNAYVTTTTDLDDNPRIVSGTVDIGTYEYQGPGSRISYAWLYYFGLPTDGSADFIDSDGDGMNNWQEWICGTEPTNAASVLKILPPKHGALGIAVPWLSVTNRSYFLERTTNLALQPFFLTLATNVAGQAGTTTFTDTNAANGRPCFYRVGVKYP